MEFVLIFLAGIVLGISIAAVIYKAHFIGTLRVDRSDPEAEPFLFLELSKGIGNISSKKNVLMKVNTESYIPQK